jgi:hypothetical protein
VVAEKESLFPVTTLFVSHFVSFTGRAGFHNILTQILIRASTPCPFRFFQLSVVVSFAQTGDSGDSLSKSGAHEADISIIFFF